MENKRKFTSLLINPDFQGKFVALFAIFGFFQIIVNYYAVLFAFREIKMTVAETQLPAESQLLDLIMLQEMYVKIFMSLTFAISFIVFVFVGIRFTHHAAGAIFRFKEEFDSMKTKKKLHPITLREGDFFRDVESSFNEMVEEMSQHQ